MARRPLQSLDWNGQCHFVYETNEASLSTLKDEKCHRFVYKWKTKEDHEVLPYYAEVTTNYQCHINVNLT